MKHLILIVLFLIPFFHLSSQTAPGKFWIQFTDKESTPYSLDQPSEFLTQRSIDRRIKQGISLDETDLPVDPEYIQQIVGPNGFKLIHTSKWMNAITIGSTDTALVLSLVDLDIVENVKSVKQFKGIKGIDFERSSIQDQSTEDFYGPSWTQISQLNGQSLHELGYKGEGMMIGVLDAGFSWANTLPALSNLFENDQIKFEANIVEGGDFIYAFSNHGMQVLSTMGAYYPDSLIGTAYEADFCLFMTEDVSSEYVIEEDHWIRGAEIADSLGVDILNTSLGYSLFDSEDHNHTYAELDGNTTRITQGSDLAAKKGMLVVTSAGNSGSSDWHFITAPADADSALTVGAVDDIGEHAFFSSFGPSSDGRVKPNVCAMGISSVIADVDSTIRTGNGTSFSSPILCGLAACLWQAHPEKTNMDILRAIEESASLFENPNDSLGHGIPDFWIAHKLLQQNESDSQDSDLLVYPNPFEDEIRIEFEASDSEGASIQIYDTTGRIIFDQECTSQLGNWYFEHINTGLDDLSAGIYFLRIASTSSSKTIEILKK